MGGNRVSSDWLRRGRTGLGGDGAGAANDPQRPQGIGTRRRFERADSEAGRRAPRNRGDAARRDGGAGEVGRTADTRGPNVGAALDLQEQGKPDGSVSE